MGGLDEIKKRFVGNHQKDKEQKKEQKEVHRKGIVDDELFEEIDDFFEEDTFDVTEVNDFSSLFSEEIVEVEDEEHNQSTSKSVKRKNIFNLSVYDLTKQFFGEFGDQYVTLLEKIRSASEGNANISKGTSAKRGASVRIKQKLTGDSSGKFAVHLYSLSVLRVFPCSLEIIDKNKLKMYNLSSIVRMDIARTLPEDLSTLLLKVYILAYSGYTPSEEEINDLYMSLFEILSEIKDQNTYLLKVSSFAHFWGAIDYLLRITNYETSTRVKRLLELIVPLIELYSANTLATAEGLFTKQEGYFIMSVMGKILYRYF